jgi:hypothetical protein
MTMPGIPGQGQIVTPPVYKTQIQCCGMTCSQGTPHLWVCPGCGKRHNEDAPPLNAEPPP